MPHSAKKGPGPVIFGVIEKIPAGLHAAVSQVLAPGELVHFQLKGAFKEALVCTDRRVVIAKAGFMTGQMFGSNIFQLNYAGVGSAEVKFTLLSGYFELSAAGVQAAKKSYWGKGSERPQEAPNCVALLSGMATNFKKAAGFIMQQASAGSTSTSFRPDDPPDAIGALDRLWALKEKGALTQAEYDAAKARLLGGQ